MPSKQPSTAFHSNLLGLYSQYMPVLGFQMAIKYIPIVIWSPSSECAWKIGSTLSSNSFNSLALDASSEKKMIPHTALYSAVCLYKFKSTIKVYRYHSKHTWYIDIYKCLYHFTVIYPMVGLYSRR